MSSEILTFFFKRNEVDIYTLQVPDYFSTEVPLLLTANSNSKIYKDGIVSGLFRSNSSVSNNLSLPKNEDGRDILLTSSLMTVTFNDEYDSLISWNMTYNSLDGRFPENAKYITSLSSCSGRYLNKTGVLVIDVNAELCRFYVKFDN